MLQVRNQNVDISTSKIILFLEIAYPLHCLYMMSIIKMQKFVFGGHERLILRKVQTWFVTEYSHVADNDAWVKIACS